MLKTIIRNLISNAMKFSFEGGTITLSSRSEGDFVTVSVKDTGKGIKKEDQDKLLKQDSHFTTYGTKNEKGSGLGLMLCKDFVELRVRGRGQRNDLPVLDEGAEPRGIADRHIACLYRS